MEWKIGNITIKNQVVLAPMAGICNSAFRRICKEMGCGLIYAEMVSDKAIAFQNQKTLDMLYMTEYERPLVQQIFGSDKESFVQAAKYIYENMHPDIIDINMGCPAPKISSNGSGSALMKNPRLCGEIVKAVTAVTDIPVTVKIRKGWDDDSVNAVEVAKICESAGAAAITVHGRTRQQYYKPPVDYDIIRAVRESVSVPVIANGDIDSAERAKEVMDITGCDLVMIGRATLGNPWIFSQINAYLENPNVKIHTPDLEERLGVMIEHIGKMVEYKGEHMAMLQARKLVVGYFKGMKGAAALRNEAGKIKTLDDLYELRRKALSLQ